MDKSYKSVVHLSDLKMEHGEGPLWDFRNQILYWVDIMKGLVYAHSSVSDKFSIYEIGQPVGAIGLAHDNHLVLAIERGFAILDLATKEVKPYPITGLTEKVRMNDGKVDPLGRFVAGTMDYNESDPIAHLYQFDASSQIETLRSNLTISNGLDWSSNLEYFYLIDSPTQEVLRFDYDKDTGKFTQPLIFYKTPPGEFPDGMTLDNKGNLWVALWGGFKVIQLSPAGKLINEIKLPVPHVTSCCLGGADLKTLYITTSRIALNAEEQDHYPEAGKLFSATVETPGKPSNIFG